MAPFRSPDLSVHVVTNRILVSFTHVPKYTTNLVPFYWLI